MKRRPHASPTNKRLRLSPTPPALQVFCRLRTAPTAEVLAEEYCVQTNTDRYAFARVLGREEGQEEMYAAVGAQVAKGFLENRSSVICVSGPPESGKRYSLFGTRDSRGLLPRVVQDLLGTSVAGHLALSCTAVLTEGLRDALAKRDLGSDPPVTIAIHKAEDVFICLDNLKHLPPCHVLLLLTTRGSIRTSVIAFFLLAAPSVRLSPNCYSLLQSLVSALHRPQQPQSRLDSVLPAIFPIPTTAMSVLCAIDPQRSKQTSVFLRSVSLIAQIPAKADRPRSLSTSQRVSDTEFLQDAIARRDVTIAALRCELSRQQLKTATEVEKETRKAVLADLADALDSMEKVYKQNKALIVDTYEEIITEKNAAWRKLSAKSRRDVETQCMVETRQQGTSPAEERKKPAKRLPIPMSPISSRTRGAIRRKGK